MFASLVVYVHDFETQGMRYFTRSTRQEADSATERVRRWRENNRARRNATARAKDDTERAARALYARNWRAQKKARA